MNALLSIGLVAVLGQRTPSGHHPKWFDNMLAGYSFAYDARHEQAAVFDPATGFMLIREPECDGNDMTLLLTRDRPEVAQMGYHVPNFPAAMGENGTLPMKVKPLPSLSSGLGIKIGDSLATVQRRLGSHYKRIVTGSRGQYTNLTYSWQKGSGIDGTDYEETYVMKAGKLIEISFTWGPLDGYADMAVVAPKLKAVQSKKDRR